MGSTFQTHGTCFTTFKKRVFGRISFIFEFILRISPLQIELGSWNLVSRFSSCPKYSFSEFQILFQYISLPFTEESTSQSAAFFNSVSGTIHLSSQLEKNQVQKCTYCNAVAFYVVENSSQRC